jgi:hypothetical protein
MAISITLDEEHRYVRSVYSGVIALQDMEEHVATLVRQALLGRPQLIDARRALLALNETDLQHFASMLTPLRNVYGRAPVAFVAGNEVSYDVAERYAELGAGGNPGFRVFEDLRHAEAWIASRRP